MIKQLWKKTCAFDAEWTPCPRSVRRFLNLPADSDDEAIFHAIWKHTDPDWQPGQRHPFIKLALSQIVSIVGVVRTVGSDGHIRLGLRSQGIDHHKEGAMIRDFLEGVAGQGYQLWGYNSSGSDLPILIQRALALGIQCPQFARRPDKPWQGNDYFDSRNSQAHVDLMEIIRVRRWGASQPRLNELAAACGIPGKIEIKQERIEGENVAQFYLDGRIDLIVAYNELDALTNHLLMLRVAHFGAFLDERQYEAEITATRDLLEREIDAGKEHLAAYRDRWLELENEVWA